MASEIELIANVARYHRRAFPKKSHVNLARLSADDRRLIARLSGILRIADGLDRTHAQSVTGVKVRALRGRLRLSLQSHASPQVERLEAERKSDLFSKAFNTDVELVWVRPRTRRGAPATPTRPRLHVAAAG